MEIEGLFVGEVEWGRSDGEVLGVEWRVGAAILFVFLVAEQISQAASVFMVVLQHSFYDYNNVEELSFMLTQYKP